MAIGTNLFTKNNAYPKDTVTTPGADMNHSTNPGGHVGKTEGLMEKTVATPAPAETSNPGQAKAGPDHGVAAPSGDMTVAPGTSGTFGRGTMGQGYTPVEGVGYPEAK